MIDKCQRCVSDQEIILKCIVLSFHWYQNLKFDFWVTVTHFARSGHRYGIVKADPMQHFALMFCKLVLRSTFYSADSELGSRMKAMDVPVEVWCQTITGRFCRMLSISLIFTVCVCVCRMDGRNKPAVCCRVPVLNCGITIDLMYSSVHKTE